MTQELDPHLAPLTNHCTAFGRSRDLPGPPGPHLQHARLRSPLAATRSCLLRRLADTDWFLLMPLGLQVQSPAPVNVSPIPIPAPKHGRPLTSTWFSTRPYICARLLAPWAWSSMVCIGSVFPVFRREREREDRPTRDPPDFLSTLSRGPGRPIPQ